MKKYSLIILVLLVGTNLQALSFKEVESTYFQAPSESAAYEHANVYLQVDKELIQSREAVVTPLEEGYYGDLNTLNDALNVLSTETAVAATLDASGRFATWKFIPEYIRTGKEETDSLRVEIYILNENIDQKYLPSKSDFNNYYKVPYKISCRYKVIGKKAGTLLEKDLGILQGVRKTTQYSPPTTSKEGEFTIVTRHDFDKYGQTSSERIGVNVAYRTVRREIFSHYGFSSFSLPLQIASISELKAANKLTKQVVEVFKNKSTLLLADEDRIAIEKYLAYVHLEEDKCANKNRWAMYHNLTLCYAWLEDEAKTSKYYKAYENSIRNSLNAVKEHELSLDKTHAYSSTIEEIDEEDWEKVIAFQEIETFATYYPKAVNKYRDLYYAVNGNLKQFVDYYNYNDFLCQIFGLDYPFQFFPLRSYKSAPKLIEGQITAAGMAPISYTIKLSSSKENIKSIQLEQENVNPKGKKDKIKTELLEPRYHKKSGYHIGMEKVKTGTFVNKALYQDPTKLNYTPDKIANTTTSITQGIIPDKGFWNPVESKQSVQLQIGLDGNLYFEGASSLTRMNTLFKSVLDKNGVAYDDPETSTTFVCESRIDKKGAITSWKWSGSIESKFEIQNKKKTKGLLFAKEVSREISVSSKTEKGVPLKISSIVKEEGTVKVDKDLDWQLAFPTSTLKTTADSFELENNNEWDASFTFDPEGNWTEMLIGPYAVKQVIKY